MGKVGKVQVDVHGQEEVGAGEGTGGKAGVGRCRQVTVSRSMGR